MEVYFNGMLLFSSPVPVLTEHLQKCPCVIVHRLLLTADDPYCSFLCVSALYTWNEMKPTPSFHSA